MLVDEIIQTLSNENGRVTEALLKTKILLRQIGHTEVISWVNSELCGYDDPNEVPLYRILEGRVLGNLVNICGRATAHPIPLGHLRKDQKDQLQVLRVQDSLAVVSQLASAESDDLTRPIPLELNRFLSAGLSQGTHLEQAWCSVSKIEMGNIIFQVRSRLLDFMLELKDKLGTATSDEEIKQKVGLSDATTMFNNAIFGPNTTILVGTNRVGAVGNIVNQGSFSSLASRLTELGLEEEAILQLRQAIEDDRASGKKASLAGKVAEWPGSQTSRAAAGAFAIGVDKFVPVVADAIKSYYGL